MISIIKQFSTLLLVFSSFSTAMELNTSWDEKEQALDYISDTFSQSYLQNDRLSPEPLFQTPQYDQHITYPTVSVVQQNVVVNNYYYSPLFYTPYTDQALPVTSYQPTYTGQVRARQEEEHFAPSKKQRLMPSDEIIQAASQRTNYSYAASIPSQTNTNYAPQTHSISQTPINPIVSQAIIPNVDETILAKFKYNAALKRTKQVEACSAKDTYFYNLQQARRDRFASVCCGKQLNWSNLHAHIKSQHAVGDGFRIKYICPFVNCNKHGMMDSSQAMASYYATHTVPDLLDCPTCSKAMAPLRLKSHYMECKGDIKFIMYEPNKK
ncbi:hypothetical protein Noda2021_01420 [Candidatus Dependentiae bacterium Noda2021]|nr:hypothetical protein Noda2021_01420 [Candidatus Dependentiae bacterium Noda2021]